MTDSAAAIRAKAKTARARPFGPVAVCPICSAALHEKRQEVGALTNQGRRVEQTQYHSSCITLMLAHARSAPLHGGQHVSVQVSWGLSPVSRLPVDGFLKMPSLTDQPSWLKFVDWKGSGRIVVEDLSAAMCAILPIQEDKAARYVRNKFLVGEDDVISEGELALHVFPYLERRCQDLAVGPRLRLSSITPFMEAARGLRVLRHVADLLSLRRVCKQCIAITQILLTNELCCALKNCAESPTVSERYEKDVLLAALDLVAAKGDPSAIRYFVCSIEQDGDDGTSAMKCLPHIAMSSNWCAFHEVSKKLTHPAPRVRLAAVNLLGRIMFRGDRRSLDTLVMKLTDSVPEVCVAALETLGKWTEEGDQLVTAAIVRLLLTDGNTSVKSAAEACLALIAKGDAHTIEIFCAELDNEDEESRLLALRVLRQIALAGDQRVIGVTLLLLTCSVPSVGLQNLIGKRSYEPLGSLPRVKAGAIELLETLGQKGDKKLLRAICPAVQDRDDYIVAEAAIRAVGRIAVRGDRRAVRVLATVFSDRFRIFQDNSFRNWLEVLTLQLAALDALQLIGEGGDSAVCEVVRPILESSDAELRERAVRIVGTVAKRGAPEIIRRLEEISKTDKVPCIKRAALQSLEKLGNPVMLPLRKTLAFLCMFMLVASWLTVILLVLISALRRFLMLLGLGGFAVDVNLAFILFFVAGCVKHNRKKLCAYQPSCCQPDASAEYDPGWRRLLASCRWRS